ncbi:ligase-associated DNA damage response endonuclease PdeM [Meridianimarinicoccus sp. RP-17]|uniref:ligase-associated DNA damage response endonuclease PdeM n=1 Tax=Meridianimarinicoccus zhengii TaxID=2056810 RepID=UPI000DAC0648|nr:ligase-associated DNA damage response endonuclease PdeM [Phycocomes zhengii]
MNSHAFTFCAETFHALPSGALWWPAAGLLCVSDLHLGKAERMARRGGPVLPPYDTADTLSRLDAALAATGARRVVCLGDSFDDLAAGAALAADHRAWLLRLMAGRDWTWVEGNHDPGPLDLPGTHRAALLAGAVTFRHMARPGAAGEVSGHYHPKARIALRGASVARPCFLADRCRVILPAFGTYTGGLATTDPALDGLMGPEARAILTGRRALAIPMPRLPARRRA